MNRQTLLLETADVALRRFDHPPHEVHDDPDGEVAGRWAIAFVEAGRFDIQVDGARRTLPPGAVLLTRPGMTFRCHHHERCPTDVCLSVAFDDVSVGTDDGAWARAGWSARAVATPRLAYVHHRLARAVQQQDAFATERWSLAALPALAADTQGEQPRGPYAGRAADLDAVRAVCEAIEQDPTLRISIAGRARSVGLTGTHLTRAFQRYVGLSPHQFVVCWRLMTAAELLMSGRTVSDSCYRAGFENLSHFCRSFRRTFGVRPSHWSSLSLREHRRHLRTLITRTVITREPT
jgi:AraC-like DNA-binding protein